MDGSGAYSFHKVSGPDWLNLSSNGVLSGTRPAAAADSTHAVLAVTDGNGDTQSITITVGAIIPSDYRIIAGEQGSWDMAAPGDGLTFTANGEYDDATGVSVDQLSLNSNQFTMHRGSTIVTLHPDYLRTLSVGNHTLRVHYNENYAETTFTIANSNNNNNNNNVPLTSDATLSLLWLCLGFIALSGIIIVGRRVIRDR